MTDSYTFVPGPADLPPNQISATSTGIAATTTILGYGVVPPDIVHEIGRITLAFGALEEETYGIADALDCPCRDKQLRGALRVIRSRIHDHGVWSWARLDPHTVNVWCDQVIGPVDARNDLLHATYLAQRDSAGGWNPRPIRRHTKARGTETTVDTDAYHDAVAELERYQRRAHDITIGLLPQLTPGFYWPYFSEPDAIIANWEIGLDPNTPAMTGDEVDARMAELKVICDRERAAINASAT